MIQKVVLYIITILWSYPCFSQGYDHNNLLSVWHDGQYKVINLKLADEVDFEWVDIDPDYFASDAHFTISDADGNLVAYSNGLNVYNRIGKVMRSGGYFDHDYAWSYYETNFKSRADIYEDLKYKYIPFGAAGDEYLIFYASKVGIIKEDSYNNQIKYSRIKSSMEDGLGALIEKDEVLYDGSKMLSHVGVCRHANNKDFWLVFVDIIQNKCIKYLVNHKGILGPFKEPLVFDYFTLALTQRPKVLFSPQANRMIVYDYNVIRIYDFDSCTGAIDFVQRIDHHSHIQNISFAARDFMYVSDKSYFTQYKLTKDSFCVTGVQNRFDGRRNDGFVWNGGILTRANYKLYYISDPAVPGLHNKMKGITLEEDMYFVSLLPHNTVFDHIEDERCLDFDIDDSLLVDPIPFDYFGHSFYKAKRPLK